MSERDENPRSGGCDALFSPPRAPGRASVLLQVSEKENLPPRSAAQAAKVTFQTPLRDPQMRRLLSPRRREARPGLDSAERPRDSTAGPEAQAHSPQLPEEAEPGLAPGPQDGAVPAGAATSDSEPGCGDPACAPSVGPPPPSPPQSPVSVDLPVTAPAPTSGESVLPPAEPPKSSLEGSKASEDLPSQQVLAAATGSIPGLASAEQAPEQIAGAQNQRMPLRVPDASAPLSHQDSELEPPTWDPKDELFRDPAEVLGTCVEVDYLEQFGASSFKESSLRKQSLFLKFDPLLKESPVRPAPSDPQASAQEAPVPMATPQPKCPSEAQLLTFDLLGALDVPVPKLPPRVPCRPIMDKLQCSQKDMDAMVEAAWKEKLEAKVLEMGMIMNEFESIAYHALEEAEKQEELSRVESQKAEQLATNLNAMKKSLFDLLKNEESLKKSLEHCMAHLDRERQRYQALKAHAEEKLRLANNELARVNNDACATKASLQAEQIRTQALEKALEQKALENEKLTVLVSRTSV
ncbi:transforming acidic coiled-coil-containing protein 3 [Suncus etruscus]|uniref:transforming acidic coiled-coil-containing protein 3 n=1 Tax=Suncus etruscus TaxID=109475 RepID=UPI00210F866F|nr:transforming acidic coiled-coil-containing protein 3 [Suncus etruscus]